MFPKSTRDIRKSACRRFQNVSCAVLLAFNFNIHECKTLPPILPLLLEHEIGPIRFGTFAKPPRKKGVWKKRPQTALGALLGASETHFGFSTLSQGGSGDFRMRSEGVLKRKRQDLDVCNTSKLISPCWRWVGPSKQGLARTNRPNRMRSIANT